MLERSANEAIESSQVLMRFLNRVQDRLYRPGYTGTPDER